MAARDAKNAKYAKGLEDLGDGCFAYLQPDGSWGLNNAGLICSGEASLLVDTLFTPGLTAQMLATMRRAVPAARDIEVVVNTHANGDHCWGNQLVRDAEIVASRRGAEEMSELPPAVMAKLAKAARIAKRLGPLAPGVGRLLGALGIEALATVVGAAPYLDACFGAFDFEDIQLTLPTRTFDDALSLQVGDKRVELIEVGPAHTKGDVLVWVPEDRVVYTGDILFIGGHPIVWEGPVSNWIAACERIEAMDAQVIVPGHGPLTDRAGVRAVRDYLEYVHGEAKLRYEAGMSALDAAWDISMGAFSGWLDRERVVVNVDTLYREFSGAGRRESVVPCFAHMARYWRTHRH
ncbi:MBL fold metallo-hydrolase [Pseudenhygromyxa sp. WMMC2535]|uniref:MBL fold metallo-hydrolase n=1 Tax=Pseudenhygromyxa sp. WMMC2535 TaxID=2712867 RepID=UPI001554F638|nr:MBL fold metallo-hydrolase [Pseudenhygromyxa sp. WMMC2535]NVB40620.1 MBL fold metallo-hydrolase [Pseudenhygromyxa sp. WMMC2535]